MTTPWEGNVMGISAIAAFA